MNLHKLKQDIAEANVHTMLAAQRMRDIWGEDSNSAKIAVDDMERFAQLSANRQRVLRFFIGRQKKMRH